MEVLGSIWAELVTALLALLVAVATFVARRMMNKAAHQDNSEAGQKVQGVEEPIMSKVLATFSTDAQKLARTSMEMAMRLQKELAEMREQMEEYKKQIQELERKVELLEEENTILRKRLKEAGSQ